jgi:hypothetical protein
MRPESDSSKVSIERKAFCCQSAWAILTKKTTRLELLPPSLTKSNWQARVLTV